MNLRANFQRRYLGRYLAMAGIGLFMSAWFAFDGFIGYPQEQLRSAAYEDLASKVEDKKELHQQWRDLARSKGWNVNTPKEKAAEFDNKIVGQFIFGSICFALSVPALFLLLRNRNQWIELNDQILTTSWGQTVDFQQVYLLNKRRWAHKGIAKAHYKDQGQECIFVFDDFKFDRKPTDEMLKHLETFLTADQIVGGPPEGLVDEENETPEATPDSQSTDKAS